MMSLRIFPFSSVDSWYKIEPVPTKLASHSMMMGFDVSSKDSLGASAMRFLSS